MSDKTTPLSGRPKELRALLRPENPPGPVVLHLNRTHRFLYIPTALCASTAMKRMLSIKAGQSNQESCRSPNGILGFYPDNHLVLSPDQANQAQFQGFTKFAVYRDPVERFSSLSCALLRKLRKHNRWQKVPFPKCLDYEFAIDLVKAELSAFRINDIDEHIRPQFLTYRLSGIPDIIVPISLLNRFLDEYFGLSIRKRQTSVIDPVPLDPEQTAQILELYKVDVDIPNLFADRMYRAEKTPG